jgi:ADP-heptose:LPS heptosyltransferase
VRIGILKPDHFGDLILAAPAIAALRRHYADLVLLCNPGTVKLANYLFPGLALEPILFPHLDKTCRVNQEARPLTRFRDLVDFLICLRWDTYFPHHMDHAGIPYFASGLDVFDVHVTVEQRTVVESLIGPYDPQFEIPGHASPPGRPRKLDAVGLCISAGFPLNAWPMNHWLSLAEQLHQRGIDITLIGGPCEATRLRILAETMAYSLGCTPRLLIGGDDYEAFLNKLAHQVDLVIATDSGTAHLASLAKPILSLFGGSPWRRFAPFGQGHAIISRQLPCGPCWQFDRGSVNLCHTRECLTNLVPDQVMACLDAYLTGERFTKPRLIHDVWMAEAPWAMPSSRQISCISTGCTLEVLRSADAIHFSYPV